MVTTKPHAAKTEIAGRKYAKPGKASQFNVGTRSVTKADVVRNQQRLQRRQNAHRMSEGLTPVLWSKNRLMQHGDSFYVAMYVPASQFVSLSDDVEEVFADIDPDKSPDYVVMRYFFDGIQSVFDCYVTIKD